MNDGRKSAGCAFSREARGLAGALSRRRSGSRPGRVENASGTIRPVVISDPPQTEGLFFICDFDTRTQSWLTFSSKERLHSIYGVYGVCRELLHAR